ncbi:MAG: hypothetical protein EOP77_01440 [Variovorax sp.]|nr:MAG: hypothetical protein EOP77_01440 [Variovorax sp.]
MTNALSLLGMLSLGLAWLVPTHFLPWMSWHSEVLAFFGVFTLAWCGWQKSRAGSSAGGIALPQAVIPFLLIAIIAFVQRLSGQIPFWGNVWTIWLYLGICIAGVTFGAAVLVPRHGHREVDGNLEPLTSFALILAIFGMIATAMSLAQVFSLWEHTGFIVQMADVRRPGGNTAQPNHLATIQVMAAASALYLSRKQKLTTFSLCILVGYLAAGIAITESRTGALSFIALLLWWSRLHLTSQDKAKRIQVAAALAALFVFMFVAWPHFLNIFLLTDEATINLTSSSRLIVWQQLLAALALHPWIGWGIGGVSKAHNAVASAYGVSSPFTYSHNLFLDLFLWVGIPASLALAIPCVVWLSRRLAEARKPRQWYAVAVFVPLVIHSMFEYPFAYGYLLAPAMVLFSLVAHESKIKPLVIVSSNVAACFLLAWSALMAISIKEYLEIGEEFTRARFQIARIGLSPPTTDDYPVVVLTQLAALAHAARWTPARPVTADQLGLLRSVALQYPWIATQYRYAIALALNGQNAEAERQFKVIRAHFGPVKFSAVRVAVRELADSQFPELAKLQLPD